MSGVDEGAAQPAQYVHSDTLPLREIRSGTKLDAPRVRHLSLSADVFQGSSLDILCRPSWGIGLGRTWEAGSLCYDYFIIKECLFRKGKIGCCNSG